MVDNILDELEIMLGGLDEETIANLSRLSEADIQRLYELANGGNAHLQVPLEYQLGIFGIDESILSCLAKDDIKGLDIGCGKGSLVNYLRERGINFEGIDLEAPDSAFFIRQNIHGMKPLAGAIPRPDNSYDLVLSFQNWVLNRAFTVGGLVRNPLNWNGSRDEREQHTNMIMQGQFTIYEGTRVLKPGRRFIVYPQLTRLDETMGSLLRMQGIIFSHEDVSRDVARAFMNFEMPIVDFSERYYEKWGLYKRTVLMKR